MWWWWVVAGKQVGSASGCQREGRMAEGRHGGGGLWAGPKRESLENGRGGERGTMNFFYHGSTILVYRYTRVV